MQKPLNHPEHKLVRRAFNNAASTYDEHAFLQREIADRLFERLDYIKINPARILELGSGTGYVTEKLLRCNPASQLVAIDLAPAMVAATRKKFAPATLVDKLFRRAPTHHAICADAEAIPLTNESIDFAISSLTLQWCDPQLVANEMSRVLRPEGLFMFTTFGPDTLKELRHAFRAVDDKPHVNTFVDMHDIGDMLVGAGFADPVMDCETITITYSELTTLMRELKGIGAHNVLPDRQQGLMGKTRWQQLAHSYEQFRVNDKLPATYEVVYGHAWKPAFSKQKNVDGQQAISLGEFKRMVGKQ
jgi:malonyl-CoA O-methyltransferase